MLDDLLAIRTFAPQHKMALAVDGRHAAFVLHHAREGQHAWRVAVASLATGDIVTLNEPPLSLWGPSWNPTGESLACLGRDDAGRTRIYLWRPGGGPPSALGPAVSAGFFAAARPRWAADGHHILAPLAGGDDATWAAAGARPREDPFVLTFESPQPTPGAVAAAELVSGVVGRIDTATGSVEELLSGPSPYDVYPAPRGRACLWIEGVRSPYLERREFHQTLHCFDGAGRDHILPTLVSDQPIHLPRWSPGAARFAVVHDGAVLLWEADSVGAGPLRFDLPGGVRAHHGALFWSADGQTLLAWGAGQLWLLPVGGGQPRPMGLPGRTITGLLSCSETGVVPSQGPVVFARDDATARTGMFTLTSGECLFEEDARISGQPFSAMSTHLSDVTPDGAAFVYVSEGSAHPGDLWAGSLSCSERRRVTDLNAHLAGVLLGQRRRMPFRTAQGEFVGAGVLLPPGWDPGSPGPGVVSVYPGGFPSGRVHEFDSGVIVEHQLLASRGYAVLTVDVPYEHAGTGDPSAAAAEAALPAVNEAARLGYVDPERMGLEGHSFGGYAVVATLVRTARFRAAVAASGAGNLISAYGSMYGGDKDGYFYPYGVQWLEFVQGGMGAPPWERPLRYIANTPIFVLDRVRTPLLLIAGGEDTAVPWLQSGEVFVGLRRLGRVCTLLLYPHGGHNPTSFPEPARRDVVERVLAFLDRHLASQAP